MPSRRRGNGDSSNPCGPSAPTTSTRRSTGKPSCFSRTGWSASRSPFSAGPPGPVRRSGWSCSGWPPPGTPTESGPNTGTRTRRFSGFLPRRRSSRTRRPTSSGARRSCASDRSPETDPAATGSGSPRRSSRFSPGAALRRRRRGRWTTLPGRVSGSILYQKRAMLGYECLAPGFEAKFVTDAFSGRYLVLPTAGRRRLRTEGALRAGAPGVSGGGSGPVRRTDPLRRPVDDVGGRMRHRRGGEDLPGSGRAAPFVHRAALAGGLPACPLSGVACYNPVFDTSFLNCDPPGQAIPPFLPDANIYRDVPGDR